MASARARAEAAGLDRLQVVGGDASCSDAYRPFIPADVVLACGVFGNVTDTDIENSARSFSMLCAPGAHLIWTRHRRPPDLTPSIRRWFQESGFEEVSFDALANETRSGVGVVRLAGKPAVFRPGHRFFTFVR